MSVAQMFPKTVEEFMEEYKMVDKDHVYSNGIEYVPIFRMKQWFEHISSTHSILSNNSQELDNKNGELISRQKAKDAIDMALDRIDHVPSWVYDNLLNALNEVPSVQPKEYSCDGCIHQTGKQINCFGCARKSPDRYERRIE